MSESLSEKYTRSFDFVKAGNSVYVDGLGGVVQEVCLPNTQLASNYGCEKTGGLLILFDDGVLELLHFGSDFAIERRDHNRTHPP
jgi:hypothetical protein